MKHLYTFKYAVFLGLFLLGITGNIANSQPSGARGTDFIYTVMPDDTLIDLATKFTNNSSNWSVIQQINNVADPYALPIGLELRIPFSLIPEQSAQTTLIHLKGQVQINGTNAHKGMLASENDIIKTTNNSFVTLQMPDNSVAAIPANSEVEIKRLRTFLNTGLIDVILQLQDGEIESVVAPNNTGTGRYEIRTPISVTGVRGTSLRVRVSENGDHTEVLSGQAQVGLNSTDGPRINKNQGTLITSTNGIGNISTLPAAPVLHTNSVSKTAREVSFDPTPESIAYRVTVSAEPNGSKPVSVQTITDSPAKFSAPGPGTWYVLVRSINSDGLMGPDSVHEFDGQGVLLSGSGEPVYSSFNQPVLLSY